MDCGCARDMARGNILARGTAKHKGVAHSEAKQQGAWSTGSRVMGGSEVPCRAEEGWPVSLWCSSQEAELSQSLRSSHWPRIWLLPKQMGELGFHPKWPVE